MSENHSYLGPVGIGLDLKTLRTGYKYNGKDHDALVTFVIGESQGVWEHTFSSVSITDAKGHKLSPEVPAEKEIIDSFYRNLHVWAEGNLVTYVNRTKNQSDPSSIKPSSNFKYNVTKQKANLEYPGDVVDV